MELWQTALYSGWTGKYIAIYFYTKIQMLKIQMLTRERHNRMALNVIINAHFDNMWKTLITNEYIRIWTWQQNIWTPHVMGNTIIPRFCRLELL